MFVVGGSALKQKRHKRKSTFTVMVIANRADGKAHHFKMSHLVIPFVACSLVCTVIACGAYTMAYPYLSSYMKHEPIFFGSNHADYEQLNAQNAELSIQNENLQQQVNVLSIAVASKDEKLVALETEIEKKTTPTLFPLDGQASIEFRGVLGTEGQQEENLNDEEANDGEITEEITDNPESDSLEYIVVFSTGAGTSVIAAGQGVVQTVTEDPEYGYRVEIDHGNGYVSIYRNKSVPKVREGSDIARGTIVFELSDSQKVGYQIMYYGKFVDPEDMMEIRG